MEERGRFDKVIVWIDIKDQGGWKENEVWEREGKRE